MAQQGYGGTVVLLLSVILSEAKDLSLPKVANLQISVYCNGF